MHGVKGYNRRHGRNALLPAIAAVLASMLALGAAGCGKTTLDAIEVADGNNGVLVTVRLSGEAAYDIRRSRDGSSVVLSLAGVKRGKKLPDQGLTGDNSAVSGWFVSDADRALEVTVYLTGPHGISVPGGDATSGTARSVGILVNSDATASAEGSGPADMTTPLGRGIDLYRNGQPDRALAELNAAVEADARCPLAYFYAARIRIDKGQFGRARRNLESALKDSAGFSEATGYLAFTLDRLGEREEALRLWRRYTATVPGRKNAPDVGSRPMNPAEFRDAVDDTRRAREEATRIERERADNKRREREEATRRQAEREKATLAQKTPPATIDSSTVAAETTESDSTAVAAATAPVALEPQPAGTPDTIDNLEQRIETNIRRGMYGVIIVFILLAAVGIYVGRKIQRRNSLALTQTFSEEVERYIRDRDEFEEEPDIEEEAAVREFEEKQRIIAGGDEMQESAPPEEPDMPEPIVLASLHRKETSEPVVPVAVTASVASDPVGERRPITEEVKALVTRMHREGHTLEAICRAADLTRTEVELIIAVRARHVERLVEDAGMGRDEEMEPDQLYRAIHELSLEGDPPRVIARKLGISTSEIHFALTVMNGDGQAT